MMETVLPFDELLPERQASAGGKGRTLARLFQVGYPVPDGLVILRTAFSGDEPRPDALSAEAWTEVQAHLTGSESTRLLWVSRTWALRAGELTGIGEDVFFLSLNELLDFLAREDIALAPIRARRQTCERYKALPPYPLLIRGRFDPFQWAADPGRRDDVIDSHGLLPTLTLKAPGENVIPEMPGSAGQVEGLVRRLDRPKDGHGLQPGEILVTKQTNIGWTLLFPLGSGHRHRCRGVTVPRGHRGTRVGHPCAGQLWRCHHPAKNQHPGTRGWSRRRSGNPGGRGGRNPVNTDRIAQR
jgi:hypothetical protein